MASENLLVVYYGNTVVRPSGLAFCDTKARGRASLRAVDLTRILKLACVGENMISKAVFAFA
jgi:hypothetical protein